MGVLVPRLIFAMRRIQRVLRSMSDARAFREIEVEEVLLAKGHGEATSVQGDTGSIAFSLPMDS